MKKVLLGLLGVLMCSSVAFAGVYGGTEVINQPYDFRNQSYITQTGDFSWAAVNQFGDQSVSAIKQTGTHDVAEVHQSSNCCFVKVPVGCPWNWHWAKMAIFTGDKYQNASYILQEGWGFHDAYVNQKGDGNYSAIHQDGKMDKVSVVQDGMFNVSSIDQGGFGVNTASVTQVGDKNFSGIKQNNGINVADVDQFGYGNSSEINQGSSYPTLYGFSFCPMPGGFGINTAYVNQYGYNNYSAISQTGSGVHTAYVNQANFCFTGSVPGCPGGNCR